MDSPLMKPWEIQQEGMLNYSSDSDSIEELDIYGRPINIDNDEEENEEKEEKKKGFITLFRYHSIFHYRVLTILCIFVPIICVWIILYALKKNKECGIECIFKWNEGGYVVIPMMIGLFCDILFLSVGIFYHLNAKYDIKCCRRCTKCKRDKVHMEEYYEGVKELKDEEGQLAS